MNMYLHELKSLRKSTIIWTCAVVSLAALFLSVYPGVAKDAEDFKQLLAGYSPTVRAMLGINLDYITSILGFYSMIFSFILLCGAIQAMNYGLSILSKESRERTADFLLVKPVSRTSIVSAKLLAAVTMILATNAFFLAAAFLIANLVKTADYSIKLLFMINLTLLFVQLILFAIGMAVSVFFQKIKTVIPLSLGIVFGFYLVGAVFATGEHAQAERYLSPFRYFDITYIIQNAGYEVPYMVTGAVIIAAAIAVSYIVYVKKDIHAVS